MLDALDSTAKTKTTAEFAKAWYIPSDTGVVRIVCLNIYKKDAVGEFCLDVYNLCLQNKIPVALYAFGREPTLESIMKPESDIVNDATPDDTILYFHSIYDAMLDEVVKLKVKKKIVFFQGITDPELFRETNPFLGEECAKGFAQMILLKSFDAFAANSVRTARLMCEHVPGLALESVIVAPPKMFATKQDKNIGLPRLTNKSKTKFLFVGRMKASKKIEDILVFFSQYLKFDPQAECSLAGWQGDPAYMDILAKIQDDYLADKKSQVKWLGQVSDEELARAYDEATAYISMSADEGFCVPLMEAMMAGVPTFAYGIPAIREVLGGAGIYFTEKNFATLAKRVYEILSDPVSVNQMIHAQSQRVKELLSIADGKPLLRLFENIPPALARGHA